MLVAIALTARCSYAVPALPTQPVSVPVSVPSVHSTQRGGGAARLPVYSAWPRRMQQLQSEPLQWPSPPGRCARLPRSCCPVSASCL